MHHAELIRAMIEKSENNLGSACLNHEHGYYDDAASRAWFAVYHVLTAALLSRGHRLPTPHQRVVNEFEKEFVKSGEFSGDMLSQIRALLEGRQMGDYDVTARLNEQAALVAIEQARHVIDAVKKKLGLGQ